MLESATRLGFLESPLRMQVTLRHVHHAMNLQASPGVVQMQPQPTGAGVSPPVAPPAVPFGLVPKVCADAPVCVLP